MKIFNMKNYVCALVLPALVTLLTVTPLAAATLNVDNVKKVLVGKIWAERGKGPFSESFWEWKEGARAAKAKSAKAVKPKAGDGGAAGAPEKRPEEIGGPSGPEPTRYGDWEVKGRCVDF